MKVFLSARKLNSDLTLQITGSKSESNRLLLLQSLYSNLKIENLSESDDTRVLNKGLKEKEGIVNIGHAGTAMRFLTAYYASTEGVKVTLTGSERMQQRPIGVLVDAVRDLGAQITYLDKDGFPPLEIIGSTLQGSKVDISATTSSQYISALLLIAPSLKNGLEVALIGEISSRPYIEMTLSLLKELGIEVHFNTNFIKVEPKEEIDDKTIVVESDWSSASYWYSLVALSEDLSIRLKNYRRSSFQGDSTLAEIFEVFGVFTEFDDNSSTIRIQKEVVELPSLLEIDLRDNPDLAQTIAITCFGLGINCLLTGLHTLKIKETDRLVALKTELHKLGAHVIITENSISITTSEEIKELVAIDTYSDHRMAMAFAPLALKRDLIINNCEVVSKSYPNFFKDLSIIGIHTDFQR